MESTSTQIFFGATKSETFWLDIVFCRRPEIHPIKPKPGRPIVKGLHIRVDGQIPSELVLFRLPK